MGFEKLRKSYENIVCWHTDPPPPLKDALTIQSYNHQNELLGFSIRACANPTGTAIPARYWENMRKPKPEIREFSLKI